MEHCCVEHAWSEEAKVADGGRILRELWQMRRGIKTFPITRKIKNVLLVDLLAILEAGADLQKAKMILKDGVHLRDECVKVVVAVYVLKTVRFHKRVLKYL